MTLSEDVLKAIDKLTGKAKNRSEFIEAAVRVFIAGMAHEGRDVQDLDVINQHADRLNGEALDVLAYQRRG